MPGLGNVLKFTALYLFSTNIINFFESAFQGLWKFELFAISFIIAKFCKLIVVLICFFINLQIIHVIAFISLISMTQAIIIIIIQVKNKNISHIFKHHSDITNEIFKYSVYIFLYIILQNIITNFNQFILALFVSPAELAFFTMLLWIISNLSIFSIILSRFAMSYISHYSNNDDLEARKTVELAYNMIIGGNFSMI